MLIRLTIAANDIRGGLRTKSDKGRENRSIIFAAFLEYFCGNCKQLEWAKMLVSTRRPSLFCQLGHSLKILKGVIVTESARVGVRGTPVNALWCLGALVGHRIDLPLHRSTIRHDVARCTGFLIAKLILGSGDACIGVGEMPLAALRFDKGDD